MKPVGFIRSLSLGLFHQWEPERLFMVVTAYVDESNTHEDSSIFVVAGYVGHSGQWWKFEKKWAKALNDFGVTYFNAKEVNNHYTETDGWNREKKNDFFAVTA